MEIIEEQETKLREATLFIWSVKKRSGLEATERIIAENEHYGSLASANASTKYAVADKHDAIYSETALLEMREARPKDYAGLENKYVGLWTQLDS